MTPEAPQPADEEFEARLSWSPPQGGRPALRPARRPRLVASPEPPADEPTERDRDERPDLSESWPDVRDDLAGLRAELARLLAEVATLRGLIADRSGAGPAGLSAESLSELMEEMKLLRRRIGLRASSPSVELDDESLDRLADSVQTRLALRASSAPVARLRRTRGR